MAVKIGSARINEKGTINGGAAGDQTGREVSTQDWYLHSKGWVVIRAKDADVREKIAKNMSSICANDNIGYCQNHRNTLTAAAQPYGYDASKVKKKVEVDCSEGVRNCVLYAGIPVGSFSTANEVNALKNTGEFDVLTDDAHCKSSDYLVRGDILVTKTKGHTVVVLSNGAKAPSPTAAVHKYKAGDRVMVSSHYAGPHDHFDKAVPVNPALAMQILEVLEGVMHPYHTNYNTYCNDGDIRGYAAVQSAAQSSAGPKVKYYKGIPVVFNQSIHDLQWACNQDGLTDDNGSPLKEDGEFGEKTYQVVRKILLSVNTFGRYTNVTSWVQCRVGAGIDGLFGNDTEDSVLSYQKAHGLAKDGVVGLDTMMSLIRDVAA